MIFGLLAGLGACLDESAPGNALINTGCLPACPLGTTCKGTVCVADPIGGNAPGGVGAACTRASDCSEGLCLQSTALVGGYCSKSCGGSSLLRGLSCPNGSQCTPVTEAASA